MRTHVVEEGGNNLAIPDCDSRTCWAEDWCGPTATTYQGMPSHRILNNTLYNTRSH